MVTIFLFLRCAQNPLHVVFDSRRVVLSQPCAVTAPARFRFGNYRQSIFQTQHIGDFATRKGGPPEVSESPGAAYGGGVEYDMRVDVMFVNMGADENVGDVEIVCPEHR